ncbi:hypothetical protein IWQ60_005283 [Tieghemiomyces parasiticus]|uniref:Septin-type G domain-containing protein n=1 Tax=Tieghemiomyces parasiticus TaxID=78921 RepID=A0A9W8A9E5_9FUNG|nr:hypothetical protein IWQ60_005283 [Tieghemiomyces parasiticus]
MMSDQRRTVLAPLETFAPPANGTYAVGPTSPESARGPPSAEGPGLDNPLLRNFKRTKPRVRGRHVIEHFNLMVVGPKGSGKTDFLSTLCSSLATAQATSLDRHASLRRSHFVGGNGSPRRPGTATSRSTPATPQAPVPAQPLSQGISIQSLTVDEFDEPMLLNLVDTPGWEPQDDGADAARVCQQIVQFLEEQMDGRVVEELKVQRDKYAPNLIVHACLYFMDPFHHAFRAHDVQIIKELGTRVNLIPVVGKTDLITLCQKLQFQMDFITNMKRHADQLSLFDMPGEPESGPATTADNSSVSDAGSVSPILSRDCISVPRPTDNDDSESAPGSLMMPFFLFNHEPIDPVALSGFESAGAREANLPDFQGAVATLTRTFAKHPEFLGRCYPWGRIDCMNPDHCDFAVLRTMLFESHRDTLRRHTITTIYEEYRSRQLQSQKRDDLLSRCGSVKVRSVFRNVTDHGLDGSA